MPVTTLYSRSLFGLQSFEVRVEVSVMPGQSKFNISGMPKAAVRQSEHRVRVAIDSSRFKFPFGRVTINLSPADLPKDGGGFDLAIAVGLIVSTGQLKISDLDRYEFYAELGLKGELRPIAGIIPSALECRDRKRTMILSREDAPAAACVSELDILAATSLLELTGHLSGASHIEPFKRAPPPPTPQRHEEENDIKEVIGQDLAKRALVIAAAGGHHMLMVGPPGTGKTMIARCLPSILPSLNESEALEITSIQSVSRESRLDAGQSQRAPQLAERRPFRAPHHTISSAALIGGGSVPVPGEISLAHNGVLFLDELTEFSRGVLDCLRQPLESGVVVVSRALGQARFPARFQLLAAMNPCPCGYLGDPQRECGACDFRSIARYQGKISGPVLDRLDLQVEVGKESFLAKPTPMKWGANSAEVRQKVLDCRHLQSQRQGCVNARLAAAAAKKHCSLSPELKEKFALTSERLGLSRRSHQRMLLVARTIADLEHQESIAAEHIMEALSYRRHDRARHIARQGA